MRGLRRKNKAQSMLEYAILVAVLVSALIAMQTYLKRGYQGKLRDGADQMGEQFSPGYTTYNYTTNSFTNSTETLDANAQTLTDIHSQTTNKSGTENVQVFDNEYWPSGQGGQE